MTDDETLAAAKKRIRSLLDAGWTYEGIDFDSVPMSPPGFKPFAYTSPNKPPKTCLSCGATVRPCCGH